MLLSAPPKAPPALVCVCVCVCVGLAGQKASYIFDALVLRERATSGVRKVTKRATAATLVGLGAGTAKTHGWRCRFSVAPLHGGRAGSGILDGGPVDSRGAILLKLASHTVC